MLDRVLTEATGKPQRWLYFPPSQSLWLLLFKKNLVLLQRTLFFSAHPLPPPHTHTCLLMHSPHVHTQTVPLPSPPGPRLSQGRAPGHLGAPGRVKFPGAGAAAGPNIVASLLQRELQPVAWQGLGRVRGGEVEREAGHTVPWPALLRGSGVPWLPNWHPSYTLPFVTSLLGHIRGPQVAPSRDFHRTEARRWGPGEGTQSHQGFPAWLPEMSLRF